MKRIDMRRKRKVLERRTTVPFDEPEIDSILEDSFPASDPPPWTLGVRPVQEKPAVAPEPSRDLPPRRRRR